MRSRMAVVLFVILLSSLLLPETQLFAQLGFVSGQIVDEQGNPVQDATVRIEGMDTPRKYKLKTDKNGKYIHAGVAVQGMYRVIVEKDGFQSSYVESLKPGFTRDDERGIANFTLAKGQARPLEFELTSEQRAQMEKQREDAKKQAEMLEKVRGDFNEGISMFNAGQFEQAAAAFQRVLDVDPSQGVIWGNLAASYSKLNQNDKALEAYSKAIELEPDNAGYYQNQGSIYATMGDSEKARALYEKAASLAAQQNPKDAAVNYYNMGVTYINSGQNQQAAEALQKAIEFDPTHGESHYQLGITMIGLGDMEKAISLLKKYLELDPNGPNAEVAKELIKQLGGS